MKLKGLHQQHVEIELSEKELLAATIGMIRKKFKLTNVDGIDDKGVMYETVEYATSHSWFAREQRGKPTPEQKAALNVIHELNALDAHV